MTPAAMRAAALRLAARDSSSTCYGARGVPLHVFTALLLAESAGLVGGAAIILITRIPPTTPNSPTAAAIRTSKGT